MVFGRQVYNIYALLFKHFCPNSKISVTYGFEMVTVTDEKPGVALWCMFINIFNVFSAVLKRPSTQK
jgi:hypothetical protein